MESTSDRTHPLTRPGDELTQQDIDDFVSRASLSPLLPPPSPTALQLPISQVFTGFASDVSMSLPPGAMFDNLISLVFFPPLRPPLQ